MSDVKVKKRNGELEDFNILKVKQSIAHACSGVDVNPLELESRIDYFLKNGIKTSEIQDNIIEHAKQLASSAKPEWLMVAGHAFTMQQTHGYKLQDKTFCEIVKYNVKSGYYTPSLLKSYSEDEIESFGKYIKYSRDYDCSYAALFTNKTKYQGKYEINQIMHMVNAMRFGEVHDGDKVEYVKSVYDTLSLREFSLATPFMSNLREGGNTASCFILGIEDDLESIFDNVKRISKISKNGGGIGIFLGFLRAKGSSVGKNENASNTIVQWIKIINDTLVAVNQGGKRAGAGTVALPVWHNDILDFLDMQTEHGDIRMKAYDVFPQITVPDIFMERDRNQDKWVTFCPFEVKNKLGIDIRGLYGEEFTEAYLQIEKAALANKLKVFRVFPNAREITKIVMRSQFETGLPYISFIDEMNRKNPNKNDPEGMGILCANLCVESYSNTVPDKYGHVCNLGSINMGNIRDFEHLAKVARMATRILNSGVDLTKHPDSIAEAHNARYRTIGIGVMGLHDYLAREFLTYNDVDIISEIFECIEYNAALESVEIAKERGSFGAFEWSTWKSGEQTERYASIGCGKYDWLGLQAAIDKYGMFNSQLTSPAPTTSTSLSQDASASVLPIFSAFFSEDNKTGSVKVSAKYLAKNPLGYGKTQAKFSAKEIIDAIAVMQKWVDTGISMELLLDQNREGFKAKDLYDAIHYAHGKGVKTIYYIRTLKQKENADEGCVACSG